jgi:SRSO17 transposase
MVFDGAMARIAGRFVRVEPRRTVRQFVLGLGPQAMQRLLRGAVWDADKVRDDVRDLVVEYLGCPDGVLIVDETGVLKKRDSLGRGSTPVHRHSRTDREQPGRGVSGLRLGRGSGVD